MIGFKLKDKNDEYTFYWLEDSLEVKHQEGGGDVETLNGNIHTFNTFLRREINHKWSFMDLEEYQRLEGFYLRQFKNFAYPRLTCQELDINDRPVRLELGARQVVNECLTVKNVKITMREATA